MKQRSRPIDAATLKAQLHDGQEIAVLDAREELTFSKRHLLMASCVPLGRLEMLVDDLVPRRSARVVWCDGGEGVAARAASRMAELGYEDVAVLVGGLDAWEAAGFRLYSGVHVPSKAFAEVVEHEAGTPWISAETLKQWLDSGRDIAVFDSRSYEEYHDNSIPGAVSVPGAELVYRFADMVPSRETTVVVNCGGRTRSIIGAQALINAGVPNKVVSLKNGTMAWHLAGYETAVGATRQPPPPSPAGLAAAQAAAAKVAARFAVPTAGPAEVAAWQAEGAQRTLYVLDVRTPQEYEAGHLPGVRSAPGGQLVQETDRHMATWGARVVLVDADGVRAPMTASWLKQMGWTDVAVMTMGKDAGGLETGPRQPQVLGLDPDAAARIGAKALKAALASGAAQLVDLNDSRGYRRAHIPGAWFATRSRLAEALRGLPAADRIVLTSPDGVLAHLAAADLADGDHAVSVLDGGTAAWAAAGLPLEEGATRMADEADDVTLKAREQDGDREAAMNAYLAWEIDLVNQMAEDDDQRFQVQAVG